MSKIDPTLTIARMAERLRSSGAAHPVAGALAQAARGTTRLAIGDYAEGVDRPRNEVERAERGEVAFGELALEVGMAVATTGADLLVLADLEQSWRDPTMTRLRR